MTTHAVILAACGVASVHIFSPRLTILDEIPRSRWLSAAGALFGSWAPQACAIVGHDLRLRAGLCGRGDHPQHHEGRIAG